MSTLSEQLLQAGLVSAERCAKIDSQKRAQEEAARQKQISQLRAKSHKPANFDRLETATSVSDFKQVARNILQEYPDTIDEIIKLAHRLKNINGGKKLVWFMYQVRDRLAEVSPENRSLFLKRALRKAGGSLELPKSK